ncbi:MAG: glutathione transferase GstA [Pseudomonadota bacterium]
MKLYYSSGACSLSPHIVLCEAGYEFETEKVDLRAKKTESGKDYNTIAEKSAVPLLVLDNGEHLTEGVAIVQYLADKKPETKLVPPNGTMERTRLHEWLNFISTELHKAHSPLFHPELGQATQDLYLSNIKKAYTYVAKKLEGKQYLMGDQFTVADAYLFTIMGWSKMIKLDLSAWPVLIDYQKRIAARPKVQEAMKKEGLLDTKAA